MNSRRQLSTSANGLVPGKPSERGFMNLANPTQPAGENVRARPMLWIQTALGTSTDIGNACTS